MFVKRFIPSFIFDFFQPGYHRILSLLSAFVYGHPSRDMIVVGVTGTNGKSTVVELVSRILEEKGWKVASASSIRFKVGAREWPNERKMTVPGRFFLQKFLYEAKKEGATHAVLEATSEGIKQFRHKGIDWDILVLTNVAPEHIEAHGSFEAYKKIKEKLFEGLALTGRKKNQPKIIIANGDDASREDFLKYEADQKWVFSKVSNAGFRVRHIRVLNPKSFSLGPRGIEIDIDSELISSPLLGEFNFYNILAAVAVARALNLTWEEIKKGVLKVNLIPGRMEFVQKEPFSVVVDYAHTPDALLQVYKTLISYKLTADSYKLICVLGSAGGGRDKWKRREMGRIAAEHCSRIIVTNEDPYDEDPVGIINEVAAGAEEKLRELGVKPAREKILKIIDRKEAINSAVKSARPGDVVIITGKGCEPFIMGPGGQKIPWDDRRAAREALGLD